MLDTHCHLTFDDFAGRVDAVLAEAAQAGVTGAITVGTTAESSKASLDLATTHRNIWCTSGVHPLYSHKGPHDWSLLKWVAAHERCVAWGELGLDNHYKEPDGRTQRRVLAEQLTVIESCMPQAPGGSGIDKPVVVHCREAYAELVPILKDSRIAPHRFVFHCFTGGPADMRLLLDFGAWVSFTGVVTFDNAPQVREAAMLAPLGRLMVETDAPFLTPAPYRKQRTNEPKYARTTAEYLAHLRGIKWERFHEMINENTERFFGITGVQ
jgi:TatD DNase family protein